VKVLSRFHRTTQRLGADALRVVATSALRDARNSGAFINWVRAATGWRVEIISGLEEGRLIHLGVTNAMRITASRVLLIDLGGGSCELTVSSRGQIRQMFSLPLGAVRLTQEFLQRDPPRKKEMGRLESFIAEEVSRVQKRILAENVHLTIATSGTAAAIAAMALGGKGGRRPVSAVPRPRVIALADKLAKLNLAQRSALPGINSRRAEIIIAGASVFSDLMTRLDLSNFRYSPLGLRDGILAQMVLDYGPTARMRQQLTAERASAIRALGDHYRVDWKFAERVRAFCLELFRSLKSFHQLPLEYSDWLAAAAMLHETGGFINRTGRHRHTYYIIAHSEMFGYTTQQRRLIAAIARYMGKSRPSMDDQALAALSLEDRALIPKAVVLLRLALALDQGRHGAVQSFTSRMRDGNIWLKLSPRRGGAELELWALEKEKDYFREVFGRELVPVLS
jgi:exopolyphosphatase/guanosine-5'-triphosphate,3'-diphosphate pyrophosphatase